MWQIAALIFWGVLSKCVLGNEAASAVKSGGVHLPYHKNVSIEKKEILISPHRIHVRTTLKNNSDRPLTMVISFPVPSHPHKALGGQQYWDEEIIEANVYNHDRQSSWTLDRPDQAQIPFINFSVTVNGKKQEVTKRVIAQLDDKDITKLLQTENIPLNPDVATCSHLPLINFERSACTRRIKRLKTLNLADDSGHALWQKNTRYEWEQTFHPHIETIIEYSYHPATGFISVHFDEERPPLESLAIGLLSTGGFLGNACFSETSPHDQDLVKWLLDKFARDLNAPEQNKGTYLYEVDYQLTPLRDGEEVIKQFILKIEHPEGGTAHLCPLWQDMKLHRLSPTTLQAIRTNFIPKKDLTIFFGSPTLLKDIF